MKTTDLLKADPKDIVTHLLDSQDAPLRQMLTTRSREYDAILVNLCIRIEELEKTIDRLESVNPSVR